MIFGPREIKSYAEPVELAELKIGEIYYSVQYSDEEMLIPNLQPLVFIGNDIDSPGEGQSYFQDVDSYQAGVRIQSDPPKDDVLIQTFPSSTLGNIFTLEHAIDSLIRCWGRHQGNFRA